MAANASEWLPKRKRYQTKDKSLNSKLTSIFWVKMRFSRVLILVEVAMLDLLKQMLSNGNVRWVKLLCKTITFNSNKHTANICPSSIMFTVTCKYRKISFRSRARLRCQCQWWDLRCHDRPLCHNKIRNLCKFLRLRKLLLKREWWWWKALLTHQKNQMLKTMLMPLELASINTTTIRNKQRRNKKRKVAS